MEVLSQLVLPEVEWSHHLNDRCVDVLRKLSVIIIEEGTTELRHSAC